MLCFVVVCVFKFMYGVVVVFLIHQLQSMSVLILPNLNQLDVVEKIILGGAGMKGSCSSPNYNMDTIITQSNSVLRLSRMVEEMDDTFVVALKDEPIHILGNSYILDILKNDGW